MTRQEFIAWEQASRDTIDVKRCYVDLAGDLVAGILLSQIVYWHLPSKDGAEKLQVEKAGVLWLAKGRNDWWEECRITAKQFDRAAEVLEAKGLIKRDVMRFNGNPTVHVRICWEEFLRDLTLLSMRVAGGKNDIPQRLKTKSPKAEEQSPPKVKNDLPQRAKSLTQTPSKTKKETTLDLAQPGENPVALKSISFLFSELGEKEQERWKKQAREWLTIRGISQPRNGSVLHQAQVLWDKAKAAEGGKS